MLPLVTCIMPTANRRAFVRRAIELFLAQDYPRKQLMIVEDGPERNADLIPADAPVSYLYLGGATKRTIGEKRNMACLQAPHEGLIAHWDDDDWHAPIRLSSSVTLLREQGARLAGANKLVFCDGTKAWLYKSIRKPWLAGGTLLYEKSLWTELLFEHRSNGEDTLFVDAAYRAGIKIATITDESLYVATVHAGNSAEKQPDHQWGAFSVETVRLWMGESSERGSP